MALPLTFQERSAAGRKQRKHMRRADHAGWPPQSAPNRLQAPRRLHARPRPRAHPHQVPAHGRSRPSASSAAPSPSWPTTSRSAPTPASTPSSAATPTSATSAPSPAPDGRLVFDINDFDETIRGPFEWDVKRMATSLILAGRESARRTRRLPATRRDLPRRYRPSIHPSRAHARARGCPLPGAIASATSQPSSEILRLAERATPLHNLALPHRAAVATHISSGNGGGEEATCRQIKECHDWRRPGVGPGCRQPAHLQIRPPDLTRVHGDPARSASSTRSPPTPKASCPSAATSSPSTPRSTSPSRSSAPAPSACATTASTCRATAPKTRSSSRSRRRSPPPTPPTSAKPPRHHQGRRVVEGQRAMQFQSDPFLGWTTIEGRDYLVRQLNDHKASVDLAPAQVRRPARIRHRLRRDSSPAATPAPETPPCSPATSAPPTLRRRHRPLRRRLRRPDRERLEAVRPRHEAQRKSEASLQSAGQIRGETQDEIQAETQTRAQAKVLRRSPSRSMVSI